MKSAHDHGIPSGQGRSAFSGLAAAILFTVWIILAPFAVETVSATVSSVIENWNAPKQETKTSPEIEQRISRDFLKELGRDNLLSHRLTETDSPEGSVELVIDLSLGRAIELACETHLLTRLSEEGVREIRGKEWQAVSMLLPHIYADSSQHSVSRENFKALGFMAGGMVGPFTTFDARFRMTQKLLDLSAFSNFQASKAGVQIAKYERDFSKQKVIFLAAVAYLEALRSLSQLKAARADIELAERLWMQARRQQEVGIATGVDVARAETRLAQEQLRYERAQMGTHDALIGLQRVTGLPYTAAIRLTNSLLFMGESRRPSDRAVETAETERLEMQIAKEQIRAARYRYFAAHAERLPKINFAGDVGVKGLGVDDTARLTGGAFFEIGIPVFEGGRIEGAIKETQSAKRQKEITYEDLRRQVEEDVRKALWAMETRVAQVRAAAQVYTFARRELQLASNRFKQGVGDNVEVVNAQTVVTNSRDDYISALSDYHTARMNLYFSLGQAESFSLKAESVSEGGDRE
jgi:outer membrane protein TolC